MAIWHVEFEIVRPGPNRVGDAPLFNGTLGEIKSIVGEVVPFRESLRDGIHYWGTSVDLELRACDVSPDTLELVLVLDLSHLDEPVLVKVRELWARFSSVGCQFLSEEGKAITSYREVGQILLESRAARFIKNPVAFLTKNESRDE